MSVPELVFADPDNGLLDRSPSAKGAEKYILPHEIVDYYSRGQQLMYYQHRPRIGKEGWMRFKSQIKSTLPNAELLALSFNRWSCRTYIIVAHRDALDRYKTLIDLFLNTKWGTMTVDGRLPFVREAI